MAEAIHKELLEHVPSLKLRNHINVPRFMHE